VGDELGDAKTDVDRSDDQIHEIAPFEGGRRLSFGARKKAFQEEFGN
jgi:hypothetical protein